jgi:hypothetical protein
MRYRLIAIDLDGTLLCPKGEVSDENRAALRAAHEAGAIVLPCTGRGWRESRRVFASVPDTDVGVFNTGALVCGLADGETRDRAVFDPDVAQTLIGVLIETGEPVLLYTDPSETGYEYIVTGEGEPNANTQWWFEHNQLRWTTQRRLDPAVAEHIVRAGALTSPDHAARAVDQVRERMPGQVESHAFAALQDERDDQPIHIIECFAQGVTKWRGIEFIAKQHGIEAEEIAVLGDQINDVPMFERAGCAVAMGNAIDAVRDVAHYHTLKNDEHGVAHAIHKMLDGEW